MVLSPPDRDLFQRRVEVALERDDPTELVDLVLEVAHEFPELRYSQVCCAQLARHRNANVRGNAVAGFGHLARRFGRLDRRRIHRLVDIALFDRSEYVRRQARSAAEDLKTFLAWEFELPEER